MILTPEEREMILVSGATVNVGAEVVRELAEAGAPVRARGRGPLLSVAGPSVGRRGTRDEKQEAP
ncbi:MULTISPECIES: hypothetical protein [unclassified Nonomuraea]|uniref:hypothetical protein n=1 Tax=unclassified Nonomuraea TaxID=2593643 RepID=UPI0033C92AF1